MTGKNARRKKGAIMKRDNPTENDTTKIEETIALLAQAVERMGAVPRLSPEARARGIKMRRGGDAVVPTIAAIATKYGIAAPNMSGDTLHAGLAELHAHAMLMSAAIEIHALITDSRMGVGRSLWSATTTLYTMLRRAARSNPAMAAELEPVEAWFRYRKSAGAEARAEAPPKATE
jgi:hypothetical protein